MPDNLKNSFIRFIATIISLIFFHYFPYLAATAYMSWHGFFSYDLFEVGGSGVLAFYWWAEVILIIAATYLIGALFFATKYLIKKKLDKADKFMLAIAFLVNLFIAIIFFRSSIKAIKEFDANSLIAMYAISAWINIHLSILTYGKGKSALYSIGIGMFFLCSVSIIFPGSLAIPYTFSLQYFGNGGNLPISLKLEEKTIEGKLLLASPENYYIQTENKLVTVKRNMATEVEVKNLSGFGHHRK